MDIASQLPVGLPAPVFVTMHIPAYYRSYLPSILSHAVKLRAVHPEDGQKIEPGSIYAAPPDKFFTRARDLEIRASRFQELAQDRKSMSEDKLGTSDEDQEQK
jgi:chemotaxis response regulator CheB